MHPVPDSQPHPAQALIGDPDVVIADAAGLDLDVTPLVARAYRELAGMVLGRESLQGTLTRVARLTQELVDGADEVSVTMIESRRGRTVAFAGNLDLAYVLDERQYEDGYGPCMDAALSGATIAIDDTTGSDLYPDFAALARSRGVMQTLAVGFPSVHSISGAVNVYGRGRGGFSPEARAVAQGFSTYAAVSVTNATLYQRAIQEAAQLTEAMRSRAAIEQAKGMIMQSQRCGPSEAFRILRETSMQSNLKLHDIAERLVSQYPDVGQT